VKENFTELAVTESGSNVHSLDELRGEGGGLTITCEKERERKSMAFFGFKTFGKGANKPASNLSWKKKRGKVKG